MSYDSDYIDGLACELATKRASIEAELVAGILSAPAYGVEVAEREGIHRDMFDQPDQRAIYIAADYGRDRDKATILRFSRFLLLRLNMWDETETRRFTRGMRWGVESLVSFACSWPGPSSVAGHARELVRIDARQREARDCYQRMVGLLEGTIEPNESADQRNVTMHTVCTPFSTIGGSVDEFN